MSRSATVSFKLAPEHYTLLKAMALAEGRSISEFLRELVVEVLELDTQFEALTAMFVEGKRPARRQASGQAG
jgi:predicted DNA-binding protein